MEECYQQQSYAKCVVPSCAQKREAGISFHKFPDKHREPKRYQEWLLKLDFKSLKHPHSVICSRHFNATDFHSPSKYSFP